ncbi:MAG TPA: tetratricopeptide repeat protein [Roseiflexaceae bacterium]|nr:tetratricopeptide repeat protein [Roseiflexaceae bacterium]
MTKEASFGGWLRRLRRARDLTQEALAEQAGCAAATLRAVESGRRRPSCELAAILAERLHVPADERALFLRMARGETQPEQPPAAFAEDPLPLPLTPLIGRERLIAELCALLGQTDTRLVTLAGPGGVGKTRVALQTAASLRENGRALFPDGVVFVPLASVAAPMVDAAIAAALGLRSRSDASALDLLREALARRRLLLVLDNFEHVLDAAPHLAALLASAPGLRVLVTSRAVLRVAGERLVDVPPLALPDHDGADPAADALRLFLERARAAAPGRRWGTDDTAAALAICRRLDGLPLAIELAAARSRLLAPAALLTQLVAGPFETLAAGPRDLPARQQTLRATLDWSMGLLSDQERQLLAGLALFAGGWTPELARATLGPQLASLDALAALVDHSLVHGQGGAAGRGRFGMLEVVRFYALELLAASGREGQTRLRWAETLLELAEEAGQKLRGPEQRAALDLLEAERANHGAVLAWALAPEGPDALARADIGARLAAALAPFWWRRGYADEGQRWIAAACAAPAGPAARARLLAQAGRFAWHRGEHTHAAALSEEALARGRTADLPCAAVALLTLGTLSWYGGRSQTAEQQLAECCALAANADVGWVGAEARLVLALVAYNQGQHERQAAMLAESLAQARALGDSLGIAEALLWSGNLAVEQGALEHAEAPYHEALAHYIALDDREGEARALHKLADLAHDQGDLAAARVRFDTCLAIRHRIGDRVGLSEALIGLGDVELKQGEHDRAQACYSQALALVQARGDLVNRAWALRGLARVALAGGAAQHAHLLFAESLHLAWAQANPWGIAVCLEGLAGARAALGDAASAAVLFGAADGLRAHHRLRHIPGALPDADRDRALTRALLGDAAFATLHRQGAAQPIEAVIAEALSQSGGAHDTPDSER